MTSTVVGQLAGNSVFVALLIAAVVEAGLIKMHRLWLLIGNAYHDHASKLSFALKSARYRSCAFVLGDSKALTKRALPNGCLMMRDIRQICSAA